MQQLHSRRWGDLEIPPDTTDITEHRRVLADLNNEVQQKHLPSEAELARHPSMHRTDTDEVLMRPGDTVIIRGTNHAWSNSSDSPCLLVGTMIDATKNPDRGEGYR